MMRKKALVYLAVVLLILGVLWYFTRDSYLESKIEETGEAIALAKVEVDDFHLSFVNLACSWNRLQVADQKNPWSNILETGRASFALEPRPLFWRRVIIKEMILENVRSSTPRSTDGSLPQKELEAQREGVLSKASAALQERISTLTDLDFSAVAKELKLDSLVDVNKLSSVQGYHSLTSNADSSLKQWRAFIDQQDFGQQAQKLQSDFNALQLDQLKATDATAVAAKLKEAEGIYKRANQLKAEVDSTQKSLIGTVSSLQNQFGRIDDAVREDIDRVQRLAKLPDFDAREIGLYLFGRPVVDRVDRLMSYVGIARRHMPTVQKLMAVNKVESPPRFEGQDIHFPFHYRYPRFLLREARLSGATAGGDTSRAYFLDGRLTGLTSEPEISGRPTQFNIDFKRMEGNAYNLSGSFDHTGVTPHDSLWVRASNFALGKVELGERKYFPKTLVAQSGDVALSGFFVGDEVRIKLGLNAAPVTFQYDGAASSKVEDIIRDVLSGIDRVQLEMQLAGRDGDYDVRFSTNLDQLISQQVQRVIGENLQEARQKIEAKVRAEVSKYRQQAEETIAKNRQELMAKVDQVRGRVDQVRQEIETRKKDAEARIEAEKQAAKKKVEEEAKKKLKDVFKKP